MNFHDVCGYHSHCSCDHNYCLAVVQVRFKPFDDEPRSAGVGVLCWVGVSGVRNTSAAYSMLGMAIVCRHFAACDSVGRDPFLGVCHAFE
jgi:hypothetical protein